MKVSSLGAEIRALLITTRVAEILDACQHGQEIIYVTVAMNIELSHQQSWESCEDHLHALGVLVWILVSF